MAATFNWSKTCGDSGSPTIGDLGASGNLFNFMDEDTNTASDYSTHPIVASDTTDYGNSYEIWIRAHFTDSFNKIDNIQFWQSTAFSPATGLTLKYKANNVGSYVTPVKTDSTIATVTMPTADPGTANVSIGGSLSGYLSSAGYSDYIVIQLHCGTTCAAGDTSAAVFTVQYDES